MGQVSTWSSVHQPSTIILQGESKDPGRSIQSTYARDSSQEYFCFLAVHNKFVIIKDKNYSCTGQWQPFLSHLALLPDVWLEKYKVALALCELNLS